MSRASVLLLLPLAACGGRDAPAPDSGRAAQGPVAAPAASAPAIADSANSPASRWVVTVRGIGPVLAGMSLAALDTALSERLRPAYSPGSACAYVRSASLPEGVFVMVERDTVARVDVRSAGVRTVDSVGVGDTEASVLTRYAGRVRVTPHKYTGPAGHYLTVSAPPDSAHLMVFETDGKTVQRYRAGRRAAVELVEGCA